MSGDIQDFLRRAAQKSGAQPPQHQDFAEAEVIEEVEILDEGLGILSGDTVGEHVDGHMDTSGFSERASHMGERIGLSDDRMEAHLQDVFEHKLGDLGVSTSPAADSILDPDSGQPIAQEPGLDIVGLFRSADDIRKSIILTEILSRPEHRW